MNKRPTHIITIILIIILSVFSLSGQELLRPSRIQARGIRKNLPELGLPVKSNGEIDPTTWYKDGCWHGDDSLTAPPFWITETINAESVVKTKIPSEIVNFCKGWVTEKPVGPVHIVTGPVRGMQFIAVCTRTRSSMSWKSIGFIIPKSGLQELVEEMTASEHLCPFIEFDPLEYELPDQEIDYEWEMDLHEIL